MGCRTVRERQTKATLRLKVRLERVEDAGIALKVYLKNPRSKIRVKWCGEMVDRNARLISRVGMSWT